LGKYALRSNADKKSGRRDARLDEAIRSPNMDRNSSKSAGAHRCRVLFADGRSMLDSSNTLYEYMLTNATRLGAAMPIFAGGKYAEAPGPAAGYIFQLRYVLFRALKKTNSRPDGVNRMERLDDVAMRLEA